MANSRRPPAFLLYIKDWVAATQHLEPDERGAYLSLLCAAWEGHPERNREMPEASIDLPDDDKVLQRITGIHARRWSRVGPRLRRLFDEVKIGRARFLRNRRLLLEYHAAIKRSEAGRKANAKRRAIEVRSSAPRPAETAP